MLEDWNDGMIGRALEDLSLVISHWSLGERKEEGISNIEQGISNVEGGEEGKGGSQTTEDRRQTTDDR